MAHMCKGCRYLRYDRKWSSLAVPVVGWLFWLIWNALPLSKWGGKWQTPAIAFAKCAHPTAVQEWTDIGTGTAFADLERGTHHECGPDARLRESRA
ncbi:MAG: hypothetical protein KGL39_03945 [Patescibacteria group bacterium]|nr:hypothetical protein [Patescibacteria group bacterium]